MEKVNAKDFLGKEVSIEIDRPLGTRHPKHEFMYMLNYGFIPNTISGDGEELDAYLVGEFEPVEKSSGKVIAIIHRTNDDDDKLIVSKDGNEYSDDAIRALTEFQEKYFESVIIRWISSMGNLYWKIRIWKMNLFNWQNKKYSVSCGYDNYNTP